MKRKDFKPYMALVRKYVNKLDMVVDGKAKSCSEEHKAIFHPFCAYLKADDHFRGSLAQDIAVNSVQCGDTDEEIKKVFEVAKIFED